jgi:cell division protein FtsW (lipid II flippase)
MNSTSISLAVDYIGSNPQLTILSVIVAVVSVAVSVIIYLKSKREKVPKYSIKSYNIIKDFVNIFEALEVSYAGQTIKNLTVSKIVFWNAGRETIDKDDIVAADPITISTKGDYKILDQKIISINNETNKFSVKKSDGHSKVELEFEYVDKNDGAVIQIIHTGYSSKNIEIHGRIKGAGKLKLAKLEIIPEKYTLFIFGLLGGLSGAMTAYIQNLYNLDDTYLILGLIVTVFTLGCLYIIFRKLNNKLPRGLEIFTENIFGHDIEGTNIEKILSFLRLYINRKRDG